MRPPATSDTYENRPDALLQRIRAILQRNLRYQHVRPLPSARRTGCDGPGARPQGGTQSQGRT